ncbi:trk system potassium uptake protein TrkA [Breznakia sp. PF5-3]|uniref:Trk system potassium transporter TrkA n=1 Tax=unclassified Breznakia TaxID=2623764 RepID=UPI0024063022|nr:MULTISPECIES: Trk system potassium transporter TrkA [unclassified Breznakia]MDF9823874.1 trk system potassium uptake protein TrkA [Breznakia sp. PM6-1]MDF9834673.1 trk system potassium uptake protein TrkA [Breznakia sp. PF5-3]MDL2276102.1 Trk system potassium transporter TrkA [Breznakia sp. OttesenSCG-928-G09]MDF9836892.1 trk system potassium uptake protein TrkA [Breznakia sp. PFB2-8]MDF9858909.1 trk system potassium uptake protein TrkA [Breznakia sp. PH5-24]
MNIIIAGCGKVGSTLAATLNEEGHDITLIDQRAEILEQVCIDLDVMGIVGNAGSYTVQQDAGVENADLFIAVTNYDELNLLCCVMAKKGRELNTIARVRNPIYKMESEFIKDAIGLSMIINPEFTAASEIARILRFPSASKIDTFAKGKAEIIQFCIKEGSTLDQMQISQLTQQAKAEVLVCAIERGEEVIIPDGNAVLQAKDKIYIVGTPSNTSKFFYQIGAETRAVKTTMIVGGSTIGYYLSKQLLQMGIETTIIEKKKERCEELSSLLPKANVIFGDATDQNLLLEVGLEDAEAFVSLTNMDEENIMLSMYAQSVADNMKLVTKVKRSTFDNIIGNLPLGSIISPKMLTSYTIIRYVRSLQNSLGSNVETLYRIVNSKAEALEFKVCDNSIVTNIPLIDLETKDNLLISCINRNGKIIIPRGNDTIQLGDTVIVVTTNRGLNDIKDILK